MKGTNQFPAVIDSKNTTDLLTLHCICNTFSKDIFDCHPIATPTMGPQQPHSSSPAADRKPWLCGEWVHCAPARGGNGRIAMRHLRAGDQSPARKPTSRADAPGGMEIFRCRAHTSPSDATSPSFSHSLRAETSCLSLARVGVRQCGTRTEGVYVLPAFRDPRVL